MTTIAKSKEKSLILRNLRF